MTQLQGMRASGTTAESVGKHGISENYEKKMNSHNVEQRGKKEKPENDIGHEKPIKGLEKEWRVSPGRRMRA